MATNRSAETVFQEAATARGNGEYSRAASLQKQGLEMWHTEDARFANELENLAGIHFIQENFELAAAEYERVLKIREQLAPKNDPSVSRVLYWFAKSQFNDQKYDLAESAMRRVLAIAEARNDSPDSLASSLYELGFLLYFVGRYEEAEPYLLKALELYEATKGLSHPDTVKVLERIALDYSFCPAIGKDPEPYFRKAIEGIQPEGEMRQTYIENLCRLAEHLVRSGRVEDARESFSRLLTLIRESKESGESVEHWVVSNCVKYFESCGGSESIAELAASEQNYDAYGDLVRRKLEHAELTLPEDDPRLAESLLHSGNHALAQGKYEEAQTLLERALNTYLRIHGEKNEGVVQTLNRLCVVSRLLKRFDKGEAAIQQALSIASDSFADRYELPETLENFALLREAQARVVEANELYEQSVVAYERVCGFPSYEAAEALYRQSGYLLRISEFKRAEETVRRAISVMDQIDALSDYERSDYLNTLASILEAAGRDSEVAALKKSADELFRQAEKANEIED
jgi:tetratricopeptide (TPR) repeat protein